MTHPTLTSELVDDLVVNPLPTLQLCAKHEITIYQLRELLESDEFRDLMAELRAIDQLRIPTFRRIALNNIESLLLQQPSSPPHAESIRKASAHYLRTTPDPTPDQPQQPELDQSQHQESQSQHPSATHDNEQAPDSSQQQPTTHTQDQNPQRTSTDTQHRASQSHHPPQQQHRKSA